jgi:predicted nucleotidyltransferase
MRHAVFTDRGCGVLDTAMIETSAYYLRGGGEGGNIVSHMLDYPQVTEELLQEIVRRMLSVGTPNKIVLFGSRARGDARADSDLDLLIIEASDLPRHKRSSRYLRTLVDLFPAKDVVVWTPEEVEAWSEVPHAFITTTLREGKTLYAR